MFDLYWPYVAIDVFWSVFIFMQLAVFAVAVKSIFYRRVNDLLSLDLPVFASLGLLLSSFIMTFFSLLSIPSVVAMQLLSLALQVYGVYLLVKNKKKIKTKLMNNKPILFSFCFLFFASLGIWAHIMRDLPSLPTHHDGIAHASFFLSVLRSGQNLLNHVPMMFGEYFGDSFQRYYPSGSHAVVAFMDGFLVDLKVTNASQVLKSWFLLVDAMVSVLAWWIARRIFPKESEWVYLAVGFLFLTYFRYPVWSTDSGGFSRTVTQFILTPVLIGFLQGSFFSRKYLNYILAIPIFLGVFHMHPTSFGLFSFSITAVFLIQIITDRKEILKHVLSYGGSVAVGVGFVVWLLIESGATAELTKGQAFIARPFELKDVFNWWQAVLNAAYWEPYKPIIKGFYSSRQWLLLVGSFALIIWKAPFKIKKEYRLYPIIMVLIVFVVALCINSPYEELYQLGRLFLHETARYAEAHFIVIAMVAATGAVVHAEAYKYLSVRITNIWFKRVILSAVVLFILADSRVSINHTQKHLKKWFARYVSPFRSSSENLADAIRSRTEPNAILLYSQFLADSMYPRTGRKGLFIYHECPVNKNINCKNRINFSHNLHSRLKEIKHKQPLGGRCVSDLLGRFKEPVYVILPTKKYSYLKEKSNCSDLVEVADENNLLLLKFVGSIF